MAKAIFTVFAIAVASWAMPSMAADATREKCTCDTKPGSIQDNGARINNAVACWSREDVGREWCTISVEAIEGDARHEKIISELLRLQSDPAGMTGFLQMQAEQGSLESTSKPSTLEFDEAREALPALIKSFDKETTACVAGFLRYRESKEQFDPIKEGAFSCSIGEATGWLRMSFQIGDVRFVYMVAPDA